MLEVKNLSVEAKNGIKLLQDVSFCVGNRKIVGLTGQSGSGKTTLVKSIMGIPGQGCYITQGDIIVNGTSLNALAHAKRRNMCGITLGFIPQNPMTAFDRRVKMGPQMTETFRIRLKVPHDEACMLAEEKLRAVNLIDTTRILGSYPAQLSGGMLQRVSVAILLGLKPKYILADEPTSAIDENNRGILIDLLQQQSKEAGILLVSHDVYVLQILCETVLVMENGSISEKGTMDKLLSSPKNIWTRQFAAAHRKLDRSGWAWRAL